MLGPEPDLFTLLQLSKLLRVYSIFRRSVQPEGMKRLSADERRTMMHVMALQDA